MTDPLALAKEALRPFVEAANMAAKTGVRPVDLIGAHEFKIACEALAALDAGGGEDSAREIVKRLRTYRPTDEWGEGVHHTICDEAADIIERFLPPQERCGDNGKLCEACSLPAHELTQVPGCGGPLPPPLQGERG